MTPLAIELLLHIHRTASPIPNRNAPAVRDEIDHMLRNEMIEYYGDDLLRTTLRGRLHVQQLCNLPWPTQAWIGADGKVMEEQL